MLWLWKGVERFRLGERILEGPVLHDSVLFCGIHFELWS